MTRSGLLCVLAIAAGGCAGDEMESVDDAPTVDDSQDSAGDAVAAPLIGSWISSDEISNGEIQTLSVYKRGVFKKRLAYEATAQTITPDNIVHQVNWGFLELAGDVASFDSRTGPPREGDTLPPAPLSFSVTGTGDDRQLVLDDTGKTLHYRLDRDQKCGSNLPSCIDHFDCKSGWCVAKHPFE